MKELIVYMVLDVLKDVFFIGIGILVVVLGVFVVGKIGIMNILFEFILKYYYFSGVVCDLWFVGYIINYLIVVWIGYDDKKKYVLVSE